MVVPIHDNPNVTQKLTLWKEQMKKYDCNRWAYLVRTQCSMHFIPTCAPAALPYAPALASVPVAQHNISGSDTAIWTEGGGRTYGGHSKPMDVDCLCSHE